MVNLWCLHGNLQCAAVWEAVLPQLWAHPQWQIHPVDLWSRPIVDFRQWGQYFCGQVAAQGPGPHILMGYSLGGRLGYHALLAHPQLWTAAVIIAADPGLANQTAKTACLQRDQMWGQRFLREPWADLLGAWDQLPVFQGQACAFERSEQIFSRSKIALAFDRWSKGRQMDLRCRLQQQRIPLLYLSGHLDRKYGEIGNQLAQGGKSIEQVVIRKAAHRVPWENPSAFEQAVCRFLADVLSGGLLSC